MKNVVRLSTTILVGLALSEVMQLTPILATPLAYLIGTSHIVILRVIDRKVSK